jgi:uncharacterized repeat protein (TIGR04138 family)
MQEVNFDEALEKILAKDSRYSRDAYIFVREALEYTQKMIHRDNPGKTSHVTGQELLEGIRQYALNQFGPMVTTVLEDWGIQKGSDFGEIVFSMVEIGLLAKTETDSRADFVGCYDFDDAFRKPFRPAGRSIRPESKTKSNQA